MTGVAISYVFEIERSQFVTEKLIVSFDRNKMENGNH